MAQKGKVTPAATSAGASITVDKVLATARTMIENDGVESFSMRKLAAELGVGTPTIYWHVGNRDELFNKLIEEITDQFRRDHAPWPYAGRAHRIDLEHAPARGTRASSAHRPLADPGSR